MLEVQNLQDAFLRAIASFYIQPNLRIRQQQASGPAGHIESRLPGAFDELLKVGDFRPAEVKFRPLLDHQTVSARFAAARTCKSAPGQSANTYGRRMN
jgi:hypothetical protein